MSQHKYKLVHFCVLYGESKHLIRLFESYAKQNFDFTQWPVALVVIDNNEVQKELPNFEFPAGVDFSVLTPGKNLGYFGAAQYALGEFPASSNATWTVVSNTDLEFADENFFSELKKLEVPSGVGVFAPQIISGISGRDQNPYMLHRPSGKKMKFLKYIFSSDLSSLIYQSVSLGKNSLHRRRGRSHAHAQKIYAAHGSFIVFNQIYFVRGLDFSHPPFLFGEEVTVAENLRAAGLSAFYEPTLKIRHQEHQATGRIPDRRMRGFIKAASHYIADRYF